MEATKIKILPVIREGSWLGQITKNHDGKFMFTGTAAQYTVPQYESGDLVNVFEGIPQEKIDWLENQLGYEKGKLNPYRKVDNFWKTEKLSRVKLTKDGLVLDISKPTDFIKYLVLKANKEFIADSWDSRYAKGTYRFAIVDFDAETRENSKKADLLKDCYIQFGKIEDNESKMKGVLRIYLTETKSPIKVPAKATKDFLKAEINKIIETNPAKFLSLISDKNFSVKGDVSGAIESGYIIRVGKAKYQIKDMIEDTFSYDELISYLNNPENSETYLKLKQSLK